MRNGTWGKSVCRRWGHHREIFHVCINRLNLKLLVVMNLVVDKLGSGAMVVTSVEPAIEKSDQWIMNSHSISFVY